MKIAGLGVLAVLLVGACTAQPESLPTGEVATAVQTAAAPAEERTPASQPTGDTFTFAEGDVAAFGEALTVWSTNYYTPVRDGAPAGTDGAVPLLGTSNQPISPPLTRADWCNIALQGTASIRGADGGMTAYVIADWDGPEQTDCDQFLGRLSAQIMARSRHSRYQIVNHPYGCGVENMPLTPFRSIAVDRRFVPYRTTLYIPALRGQTFTLEGRTLTHDGYVFAADRGGAIVGNHIDFFSANQRSGVVPALVTSSDSRTVQAYRVPSQHPAAAALRVVHAEPC
jgi:3D (Asp-Asp-Asp) domain-containing protein